MNGPTRSKAYNDPEVDAATPLLLRQSGGGSTISTIVDIAKLYLGPLQLLFRRKR